MMGGVKKTEEILKKQYPLHCAVRDGDMETAASLLETGQFDLYQEDGFYGWTPTHWAAYFGKLMCLMQLLEHGSSCDAATLRLNQSPAHIAALGSQSHCLKWLLHCGSSFNRQDYLGESPLHKAARTGSMECVSLLISQGASLSLRNHSGHTPSQVAAICGFHECSSYLEKAMQNQQQPEILENQCPVENNNSEDFRLSDISQPQHCKGMPNGFSENSFQQEPVRNGHLDGENLHCDMEMDSCDTTPNNFMHFQKQPHINRIYSQENGIQTLQQNGFSVEDHCERQYVGIKRGREEYEENCFKRRRCNESAFTSHEEKAHNNNVLSSYNAILAVSTDPLSPVDTVGILPSGCSGDKPCQGNNSVLSMENLEHFPSMTQELSSHSGSQAGVPKFHRTRTSGDLPVKCIGLHSHMI